MLIIDEEGYLSMNGASRQSIGDCALHKNRGRNSDKTWKKIVQVQADRDSALIARREALRAAYREAEDRGELRPPNRIERLTAIANGHPDNASVRAARAILEKMGVSWA